MTMSKFINAIKHHANVVAGQTIATKIGIITNYDRNKYAVRVSLQPEEVETGWLPIFSPMVGKQWGFICPPDVGTMAAVMFIDGNVDAGFVCLFGFGNEYPPPPNDIEPGGFLFYTKAGTQIEVSADGDVTIKAKTGKKVSVNSDALVRLGNDAQTIRKLVMETFKEIYNEHTHPGDGTPPDTQYHMTDSHLTTVIKGN